MIQKETLAERLAEFVEFFNEMETWQDRFNYLIEIGEHLSPMLGTHKNTDTLISTCNSKTYFEVTKGIGETIFIMGESNSAIVSGLIGMLSVLFHCQPISQLKDLTIDFHYACGLMDNMTEQRKATLQEMINRITRLC